MASPSDDKILDLQIANARIQEQYNSINMQLKIITTQIEELSRGFVRADSCRLTCQAMQKEIDRIEASNKSRFERLYSRAWWIGGLFLAPTIGLLIANLLK